MTASLDKHQLAIFGEVLFDIFADGHSVLGGAPFNVAWHLQAFGMAPLFISRVGDDAPGRQIRQAMNDWGMDNSMLQTDPGLATGQVTIELVDGEPAYDIVEPVAYDRIDASALAPLDIHLLYHGSLALRNATSREALQRLRDAGPDCIFVDVNLRPPWWNRDLLQSLLAGADWAKLNHDEFTILYADATPGDDSLSGFIQAFDLQGAILTHGKDGAEVMTRNAEHFTVTPRAETAIVDTVGAGDAFTSVMIMGIVNHWPLPTTLKRAQDFAAAILGKRGATVADIDFYRDFIRQWSLD